MLSQNIVSLAECAASLSIALFGYGNQSNAHIFCSPDLSLSLINVRFGGRLSLTFIIAVEKILVDLVNLHEADALICFHTQIVNRSSKTKSFCLNQRAKYVIWKKSDEKHFIHLCVTSFMGILYLTLLPKAV